MSASFNPFAALLSDNPEALLNNKPKSDICELIESSFGFTLNPTSSCKKQIVYLEDVAKSFPGREIDLEILEHALFERLFLNNPEDYVQSTGNNFDEDACENKVITYLYKCYMNITEVKNDEVKEKMKSLILRNVITSLKQPDLYVNQDLFIQYYDILREGQAKSDEFFIDVMKEFLEDEIVDVGGIKEPYKKLLKCIHVDLARGTIMTLDLNIVHILKTFTSHEELAEIFMEYNEPSGKNLGMEYANTLLGAFLSLSILPKTPNGTYDFFQNPLDQASNSATENLLFSNADKVSQCIHGLILNLLKCSSKVKGMTLAWLGGCLKANADRGKLWNAQVPEFNPANYTTVSDGFMINLGAVLMRLCQPFCNPDNEKKILKVDPTYCAVENEECEKKGVHLLGISKETCLLPASSDSDTESNPQRPTAASYNFMTECFYMGHRALALGFTVTVDKLVRLNQEMGRIERAYNDALNQAGGMADVVEAIKQRMSSELSKYLSIKATLSEPNLIEMIFHCVSASCHWLSQVAVHLDLVDNFAPLDQKAITFPIEEPVPSTLKCIPEFVVENIVCSLVFLRRFNPKVFEVQGYTRMKPILTFILVYMGSPERMKNPHLRARLAEALEAFLPFHKDEPTGLNTLGGYQRERLFKEHEHRKEIVTSLLEVFVGIEMTGQSVQFEQKFNYRRPMYLVMDYLWQLPEHQKYFQELAELAELNMEAVSPPLFLRFINLLMNDAVFLLDEALSNMAKLREMHTARENGAWESLSPAERNQNVSYMSHIGMMARFDNILGRDTIRMLERLTSKITIVFTHSTMVDRVAAMLNYFLLNLVGPNQKNFKVKDQKDYSFEPAATVLDICKIYVNLKESDAFCLAVSQDGRSYSPQLFALAEDVLVRIGGGLLVAALQEVALKVSKKSSEYQANEVALADAPEHFLDPIMSTLMMDPVILPSSKQTVDRTTIARHLLSDQTDPFNRSPLTMDQVIPNTELMEEIRRWLEGRKKTNSVQS